MNKILLLAPGLALLGLAAAATMTPAAPEKSMQDHDMAMMHGAYQPYTKAAFDAAKGTQRVLFFHATWCPTCKAANTDLTSNMAKLPAGVTVFKTDYDKETALKKQYAVTYQHTFVLVDAKGKALKKWSGGGLKELMAATAKKM